MVTYPDTSFLLPLYIEEEATIVAHSHMQAVTTPLVFTPFHRLEVRTGLRARVYRQETSLTELRQAFRLIDEDLADDTLHHTPLNWSDALREAERLGEEHLTETGVRSGDLLHIASAVMLGAREFVTFDHRQTKLARRAGLKVKTWKLAQ